MRLPFVCLLVLLLARASPCQVGVPDRFRETLKGWLQRLRGVSFDPVSHRSLSPDSVNIVKNAGIDLYGHIVDYSLLIRRTEIVESRDFKQGSWSFPNLMKRTFRLLGQADATEVDGYFRAWAESSAMLSSRWAFENPNQPLSAIPLRLLAVVNRFDLGRVDVDACASNLVCGAEFRFVYSGIEFPRDQNPTNPDLESSRDPYFTAIVEFVLPALSREEFQRYTDSWIALSLPSLAGIPGRVVDGLDRLLPGDLTRPLEDARDPAGINALEGLLESLLARWSQDRRPYVRIRTNARVEGSGTVWQMDQRRLDPAGLVSVPLDQEPGHVDTNKCVGRDSPLGNFVALQRTAVLKSSHNFYDHPVCGDTPLTTCYASPREGNNRVLTLSHDVAPPGPLASLDRLRFAVSIASCRGCHGVETRGTQPRLNRYTQFDQLKYREPNEQTSLPPFLAGNDSGNASLDVWTVAPPPVLNCAGDAIVGSQNYNDMFRRFLYQLVVSATPPWPPQGWDDLFDRMNLPAFQTH
jgi:hypothetical protein